MIDEKMIYRGSRKHVLDWVEAPGFLSELNEMLKPTGMVVRPTDRWMPTGYASPNECRLDQPAGSFLPAEIREDIGNWWLKHRPSKANTPNWDLVATCQIAGQPGLVLVEAKANKNEMHTAGKSLAEKASDKSIGNHEQIAGAIEEARQGYEKAGWLLGISRDRSYQLSNRLAFSWKLATYGIPVALIYLGFLGDEGICDAGKPFISHHDWLDYFQKCSHEVLQDGFCELEIRVGETPTWLLVRSLQVIESSPLAPLQKPG